jgi:hypothetical protein
MRAQQRIETAQRADVTGGRRAIAAFAQSARSGQVVTR